MRQLPRSHQQSEAAVLRHLTSQLPPLPPVIRYHDDFEDRLRTISDPRKAECFEIHADGQIHTISFSLSSEHFSILLKQAFLYLLGENLSARTAATYVNAGTRLIVSDVVQFLEAGPTKVQSCWAIFSAREPSRDAFLCVKTMLRVLCRYRIGDWAESYNDVIAALPLPFVDKYAVVRSGDAFLTVNDEAAIVRYLNESALNSCESMSDDELRDAGMLLCGYQFGMRPIQIALLTLRDARVRHEPNEEFAAVHLTFRMVKQRNSTATKPLLRRVKREWTPIFVEIDRRASMNGQDPATKIFGMKSTNEASRRIGSVLRSLVETDASAVNLRHTAAQRLVDAGASQEELAEFLGHSDITTALVYYETSANQAERVNKALGISDIYQRVARIAHARFISLDELAQLKEPQQLGGAPHGVSIAGIGGCSSGQPVCPYNPIMSCYGCRKFMPIHDLPMHEKVLSDFRGVARLFHDASRGDSVSPAYLQLERTISEVQAVVNELESAML